METSLRRAGRPRVGGGWPALPRGRWRSRGRSRARGRARRPGWCARRRVAGRVAGGGPAPRLAITGPSLATDRIACPASVVVVTSMRPPAMLCAIALSRRFATRLLDELPVAFDAGRVERRVQLQVRGARSRAAAGDHLFGHRHQVDRLAVLEAPLAAGQVEQRLDQPLELLLGGEHALVRCAQRLDAGVGVRQRHLSQRLQPGERCAQLVGGVGDELALGLEGRSSRASSPSKVSPSSLNSSSGPAEREPADAGWWPICPGRRS